MRSHFFLVVGAAPFATSTVDAASPCCTTLASLGSFRQKVFLPESEIYNERLESIFSRSARQAPWCVLLPESAQDASEIMKTVSKLKCPFGIRSGGHGMHRLSNSVEGGITIDFGMKGIVSIGPGMRSGHIYDEIMDDGIVVTAGRVAPVGAAGFIAGGGISYHWPSHGWGCDNVINFEMILANGTILNANEQQNRDLWVAQRGSSGNFGLITRYDMRAISYANPKVPVIWAGAIEYDWSAKREFVDRWVAFTKRHALDMNSSSMFQFQYDTTSNKWQLITIVSNTANIANASTLEPIISMDKQLSNDLRSDTMGNFTREFFADVNDKYHIWFTSTYTVDPDFILYTQEQHQLLVQQLRVALPNGTQFTSLTTHHAITPTAVSHSNGNNVLGLEKRVANNTVGHMFLIWVQLKTAQDEVIALPIVQAWHKKLEKEGNRRRINWNWEYLNYAHGLQDPVRTYGEENIGKLRKASKKYDPEGVFQRLRGSGFKIPVN